MLLRIREYSLSGVRGRVIQTARDTISVTDVENGAATLSFSVSTATAGRFAHDVFVVGVEYATEDGKFYPLTRNNLFRVSANSGDDADATKTITFKGATYPFAMLAKHWVIGGKDGKIDYTRGGAITNAGDIAKWELDESRGAGWAPQIGYTFTAFKDSDGVDWLPGDRQQASMSVPATQDRLIKLLVEQGMCEVETRGTELRLLRPGTGRNLTNLVLGGVGFERIPVKVDAEDQYTRLHVVMDGNRNPIFSVPVPGADTRWGTVDALITLSGVTDRATAEKIAAARAAEGAAVSREEAFEWTPQAGELTPWKDFQVGDTLTARIRGGKRPRRVIGLVVREQSGSVTVRAVVGERIATSATKVAKKLGSIAVGGITGGSGESFTHTPLPAASPMSPLALRVVSNVGSWGEDGVSHSEVKLEWEAVTADTNGQPTTVIEYEVWARPTSGLLARETAVAEPEATITSFSAGREVLVAVRAKNLRGVWSEFSHEVIVTPAVPSSIVPKAPGVVTVASNVGAWTAAGPVATVTLTIPAVTQSTDNEPIEIAEYELWDANGPLLRVPASPAEVTLPAAATATYRARARSALGVWGDLSVASATVTGAKPDVVVRNPTAPVLTTGAGNAFARWDGTYVSGGTSGAHRVDVEARIGTGEWVVQGTLIGAGQQIIKLGEVGDTIAVRLRAYDQLGRLTGTSAEATVTVVGVPMADLDQEIQDALTEINDYSEAIELASGKLTLADRVPVVADGASKGAGSLWMVRGPLGFTSMWEWDGTIWVETPLSETIIPKVAIGAGTYGELEGDRMKARSITAEKVLITAGQNEAWDGNYTAWNTPAWGNTPFGGPGSAWSTEVLRPGMAISQKLTERAAPASKASMYSATRAGVGVGGPNLDHLLYVGNRVGQKITAYSHWYVDKTPPGGMTSVSTQIYFYNEAGSQFSNQNGGRVIRAAVVPGEWFRVGGTQVTVPAGALYAEVRPTVYYTNNTTDVNGAVYYLGGEEMYWANAGELLVDGSVLARHVEMDTGFANKFWANEGNFGKIHVDHLSPNVGDTLNISANGTIQLIAGEQEDLSNELAAATNALTAVEAAASTAQDAAAAAAAAAAISDGKALVAQQQAQHAADGLAVQQSVFVVTPTGAEVRSKDASDVTRLEPGEISMLQGGVKLFRVKDSQVIANELVANRAQLANHIIEESGTRTVIRAL